jgi:hypothetical protein
MGCLWCLGRPEEILPTGEAAARETLRDCPTMLLAMNEYNFRLAIACLDVNEIAFETVERYATSRATAS